MPLIESIHNDPSTRIICWKTTESDEELLEYLNLSPYRVMRYLTLNPKQATEYLGLRACLKVLDLDLDVLYNDKGKPYLPASRNLSISHSFDMVCVGLSKYDVGIDIEKHRPEKIINTKRKFIRPDEDEWIPQERQDEYLHIIWGIKEGLYKLTGGNLWNFLHHYKVEPFELVEDRPITCWISEDKNFDVHNSRKFQARFTKIEDYFLVWVLDNKKNKE